MSVLIHACTEIHMPDKPVCACRQTMSRLNVSGFVRLGVMEWVTRYSDKRKAFVPDYKNAYFAEIAPKTPRVATVEQEHIEYAYIDGNRRARMRIEEFGRLQLAFYDSLIKLYDADTLQSIKFGLKTKDGWSFGRGTAVVDRGDLIKPLPEEANDQSKSVVGSAEKGSSGSPEIPGGVSQPIVPRPKRRARKNDQLPRVRPATPSGQLTVPPIRGN